MKIGKILVINSQDIQKKRNEIYYADKVIVVGKRVRVLKNRKGK